MVSNLMQLYLWTGEERYRDRAEAIVRGFSGAIAKNVFSHTGLLTGALDLIAPAHIVIVVPQGGDANALRHALAGVSLPNAVVQEVGAGESVAANSPAHGKKAIDQANGLCASALLSAGAEPAALREAVREGGRSAPKMVPVLLRERFGRTGPFGHRSISTVRMYV
jgi:uncharacterized protein YyaL (SSP411 family)